MRSSDICYYNEDTQPVIRAIGVSHDKIFDLTVGVHFIFYNNNSVPESDSV